MLNHFVYTQTFKIETQRKVKDDVQPNEWTFSLDLTDAYLHIPIHHRFRKYLRFTLRGRVYQFKALPFGLSTSPFVFTHLMTVIATFLRRRAITLHPYLDDWLARNQNRRRLLEHRQFILSLINSLGLIINYEKSDLVPAQVFTFIGMEFLTHINIVRVPQIRQMKIMETVRMFSQKTSISARDVLSLKYNPLLLYYFFLNFFPHVLFFWGVGVMGMVILIRPGKRFTNLYLYTIMDLFYFPIFCPVSKLCNYFNKAHFKITSTQ